MASAGRCRLNVAHGLHGYLRASLSLSFAEVADRFGLPACALLLHTHAHEAINVREEEEDRSLAAALACRPGRRRYAIVTTRGHSPTAAATSEIDSVKLHRGPNPVFHAL